MAEDGGRMQALMLTAIGKLELVDVAIPTIEHPDEVLLKVHAAGVCGSDLHGYTGQSGRREPPLIMGHEATGEVVAVGDEVEGLPVGTRVAIHPVDDSGRPNGQGARRLMGKDAPGAYAPYVVWPAANLFPLPDTLPSEVGALAEPLSVALHAVGRLAIRPSDSALVVGAGPIGLLVTSVLKQMGVAPVIVSDLSDERLEVARAVGADETVHPSRQNLRARVEERTQGRGVDLAVEAVGVSATVQQTVQAVRDGGQVLWIGNNQRVVEVDMQRVVTGELTVKGSYGMSDEDFVRAIRLLDDGRIPAAQLINRRASLAQGPALFDELLGSPGTIKCVFDLEA